ncbi:MAG TPA: ATP-binding cassette domain-containing protein [Desulfosporosinus sp.]|nr:ATP-binding cassette domain-containing protein [Desulfosporosinus sp.]
MIEVEELTKVYHEGRGIRNISFQVKPGTAFGFLGPNGAGKTTTIRLIMGLLKSDSGRVTINEYDCWKNKTEVKKIVSYLPGELHFTENLIGALQPRSLYSGESLIIIIDTAENSSGNVFLECGVL